MADASNHPPPPQPPSPGPEDERSMFSQRSRRQLSIWAAGSASMLLSALITRRAILRRNNWTRPLFFYHNDQAPITPINAPLEALEALTVASINTFSFGIMFSGGMAWAFDIGSVQEWRERTRKRLGYEEALERDKVVESVTQDQWIAEVLSEEEQQRKTGKD